AENSARHGLAVSSRVEPSPTFLMLEDTMRPARAVPAHPTWHALARRALSLAVALGLALSFGAGVARSGAAQEASAASWEQLTGTSGTVVDLVTPSSGALLAVTTDGLYRSDDGGAAW